MSHTSTPPLRLDRDGLITHITAFLSGYDAPTLAGIRETLGREIATAGPAALSQLNERLSAAGADWDYYSRDPLVRRIHHVLADLVLEPDSALHGVEHIAAVAGAPVVLFANHLSYSDANLLEVLLHRSGESALAQRLTVIAGPKVYSSLKRRFSSLCFSTIKTPQSSGLSSEEAVMNPREVARAARRSIEVAHERLHEGDALLVFAEGTRSRTRGMQQMLSGVTRYLEVPGTWVLPVGITGSEALFPIGDETVHSVRIVARAGQPIEAKTLGERAGGDRRLMIDAVGLAIARLLPVEYHGVYGSDAGELDAARTLLHDLAG
jgi:1-acyl-sn-glycerol-3-phosphate acyltransferase